jgi:hypothetical protein
MSDENAIPALKVGVLPRVIAAGMERRNGKWVGFATLSLMPWTDSQAFTRSVTLSHWPVQIEELLKEARLFLSPIRWKNKGEEVPAVEPVVCSPSQPGIALRRPAKLSRDDREQANTLWKTLIANDDDNTWSYLIEALKKGQQGSSLDQLACQPPGSGAGAAAANNATEKDPPPSDVIAYPRADAALLYGFQRAREVLRAVRRENAGCHVGNCVIKTGGRFLDLAHFSFHQKPWLGLDQRPPVRFAQATQIDAPTIDSLSGFAERDSLLAQERTAQEALYQSQLTAQSDSAKKQNAQRKKYLKGDSVADRVTALQDHAKARATSLAPSDCADACGPSDDDAVNKATDQVKAAHGLGSLPDVDELGNPILSPQDLNDAFDISIDQAQQRLFAITAMPSLARLFNLVIDVEFDLNEFEDELGSDEKLLFEDAGAIDHWGDLTGSEQIKKPSHPLHAYYVFLTTNLGRSDFTEGAPDTLGGLDPPRVWTFAKFRKPDQLPSPGEPGHFWPCSREEVDIQLHTASGHAPFTTIRDSCAVFQYDGVVDLGVVYCPDGVARNPRYDIVCLDTIQTVESDMQSDRRLKRQADTSAGSQLPSTNLGVQTRRTGGLALIDRWRQDQAVSQITTAQFHLDKAGEIVLDAEDMTSAYRLDVGIDVAGGGNEPNMVWRSLMNRKLKFGSPDPNNETHWIESVVASLYDWGGGKGDKNAVERRRRADGASLSIASRLRQNAAQRDGTGASTAFVEQIMVAWHGDPLGVDCLDPHGLDSSGVKEEETGGMSMPASGLLLDISYGLEDSAEDYRPPALRYGWPYHLGLRPVYLGGVILPIESAVPRYEMNFGTGSGLPSRTEKHGRRFLRHERIEAPPLTVPEGIVSKVTDETRALDPASVSTGASCILRTWIIEPTRHQKEPASTVRIVFAPIMQLDQAVLHGVFDEDAGETIKIPSRTLIDNKGKTATTRSRELVRPRDGLKSLDFAGDRGQGTEQAGGFPHFININTKKKPDKNPRGPAVFRLAGNGMDRNIPFYPDPAAAYYVIAARRPNTDDDYLEGAITVPIYGDGVRYPNIMPLAIEVRKADRRSAPVRKIEELFPNGAVLAHADKSGAISGGGGLPVRHLIASLPPGEEFEIDVWCVPDSRSLLDKFDIVESVAVLLMRDSAVENFADGEPNLACLSGLERYFPDAKKDVDELRSKGKWPYPLNPLCGPGGISLPQSIVMQKVADAIFRALCSRPIPELAAVTSIHAVHAVDIPLERPQFVPQNKVGRRLEFVRLNNTTFDQLMLQREPAANSKASRLLDPKQDWSELSDDGATSAIISADITIDLLTTSDFELRARMVSPASAVFDDVNRGRTAEEKARGAFRPVGWIPQLNIPTAWPRLTAEGVAQDSKQLFGFSISADGCVDLPAYWAPLLKMHNLPDVEICKRDSNLRSIDLLYEQQQAARLNPPNKLGDDVAPTGQGTRVQYVQPFHDGLARKLELQLVATSRFSNLFPEDEDTPKRVQTSDHFCAWLPATKRPDPISAKSLRPSFTWVHDAQAKFVPAIPGLTEARSVTTAVRSCSIRLPFDRPHFTSGEGERVGIVIWPPDLMLVADPKEIEGDHVRRSEHEGQKIWLDDAFSDSDLGPGGDYVTRWGADPIREGPRPKGWLIPAKAFSDFSTKAFSDCPNPGVEFEANVLMPIPRKPDASQAGKSGGTPSDPPTADATKSAGDAGSGNQGQESSDTAGREFMLVSLLTYEPRFDIDYERWYIDVHIDANNIPEPFIRLGLVRFQKHAREELQVSEPIAEWVQVMPKRAVSVSVAPPDALSLRTELTVEVSTPAAYEGSAPLFDLGSDHPSAPGSAPFMRAYLLREDLLSGSGSVQTIVPPERAFNTLSTQLLPQRTPAGTIWGASIGFVCTSTELGKLAGSSYSVFIEEVETYLPTANPFDDLTGVPAPSVMESGPRFAAIVPITIPKPVVKPPVHASVPPAKNPVHVNPVRRKPISSQEYRP